MVEELRVYCLRVINQNVTEATPLGELTPRDLCELCSELTPDLSLTVALSLPLTDLYWLRRCRSHYPPPHTKLAERQERARQIGGGRRERVATPLTPRVGGGGRKQPPPTTRTTPTPTHTPKATHTLPPVTAVRGEPGHWKKAYLETHLSRALSSVGGRRGAGGREGWRKLVPLLQLCGGVVTSLSLPSVPSPPPPLLRKSEGGAGGVPESANYPDVAQLLPYLPNLKEVSVRYHDVSDSNDGRGSSGVSLQELSALAPALTAATPALTHLSLHESCLDDEQCCQLADGLRCHPALTSLDLRHNQLTSSAVPPLVLLLSSTSLTSINLQHNDIGLEGAEQLGKALSQTPPPSLQALLVDLNPLGGLGGAALVAGAAAGGRLKVLSMAGCRLDDGCWDTLTSALPLPHSLTYLSMAANKFTKEPPPEVVAAAESCGARILLSNLDGTTYFLGPVSGGRQLPAPLTRLQERLTSPPVPPDPLTHHLGPLPSLHGLVLHPQDFTLEEELRGMCLFTKSGKNVL